MNKYRIFKRIRVERDRTVQSSAESCKYSQRLNNFPKKHMNVQESIAVVATFVAFLSRPYRKDYLDCAWK